MPIDVLSNLMTMLSSWRDDYLHHVGVPSNFDPKWDFVSAVTACEWRFLFASSFKATKNARSCASRYHSAPWVCVYLLTDCVLACLRQNPTGASDATYHIMWIIMFNALDDFGIQEVNDMLRAGNLAQSLPNHMEIEARKRKVMDEALRGAIRIAALVSPSPVTPRSFGFSMPSAEAWLGFSINLLDAELTFFD